MFESLEMGGRGEIHRTCPVPTLLTLTLLFLKEEQNLSTFNVERYFAKEITFKLQIKATIIGSQAMASD